MSAKKPTKKELRLQIAKSLTVNFEDLKERISTKKFERNVRKASKALLAGIKPKPAPKKSTKTKAGKKLAIADDAKISVVTG